MKQEPAFVPPFQKGLDLTRLNTLRLPSRAEEAWLIETEQHVHALVEEGRLKNPLILGGGSNLVLNHCIPQVLLNRLSGVRIQQDTGSRVLVTAASGENWHELVSACVEQGVWGIENLALIPGTVGAAPVQNIGAYGRELEEVFVSLEAINLKTGQKRLFDKPSCQFGYRHSFFKTEPGRDWFITAVTLQLARDDCPVLNYAALEDCLEDGVKPDGRWVFDTVCRIRREKLPDPAQIPNAGSFFKNPVVSRKHFLQLQERFPEIPGYPMDSGEIKIPAGWLIDQRGWKQKPAASVGVHERQALVLINRGQADYDALTSFARAIMEDIQQAFGIRLEQEPVDAAFPAGY